MILTVIYGCVKASQNLHSRLLENIVKCPMSFFDTVPLGRVLNRFSKDIDVLDFNIPQFSQNLVTTLCPLVSTIIIIAYTIPPFIGVVVPLLIVFGFLQVDYWLIDWLVWWFIAWLVYSRLSGRLIYPFIFSLFFFARNRQDFMSIPTHINEYPSINLTISIY